MISYNDRSQTSLNESTNLNICSVLNEYTLLWSGNKYINKSILAWIRYDIHSWNFGCTTPKSAHHFPEISSHTFPCICISHRNLKG